MGYHSSSIKIKPDGLYTATITYKGWFYNWDECETFKTISECEDWLLTKRCYRHTRDLALDQKKAEKKKMAEEVSDDSEDDNNTEVAVVKSGIIKSVKTNRRKHNKKFENPWNEVVAKKN